MDNKLIPWPSSFEEIFDVIGHSGKYQVLLYSHGRCFADYLFVLAYSQFFTRRWYSKIVENIVFYVFTGQ